MNSHTYDNPTSRSSVAPGIAVQVVVPARNEEDCIGRCLKSLAGQQGIRFAITVVDDSSSDRTRAIAESFAAYGVRVIAATEPASGVSGKCNALMEGVKGVTAKWILFTDADTFHYPGSLAGAVAEAEERGVDLLSYSPEQETGSLAEMALMPVVFADLVRTYPPLRVNDPDAPAVAANGQYLLVRRTVYESLGGHKAVADKILDDVELARIFKASHHLIWFRQGSGLVRARMYRTFPTMIAGWTKNLVLLFRRPLWLAAWRMFEFLSIPSFAVAAWIEFNRGHSAPAIAFRIAAVAVAAQFAWRIRQAHFPAGARLMSFFGLPIFAWLLLRSWWHMSVRGAVTWKGRSYNNSVAGGKEFSTAVSEPPRQAETSISESPRIKS